MATQPSANPKICSHSFSECSLNLVSLQCTVYAKRVFCLACLGVSGCCGRKAGSSATAGSGEWVASSNVARGAILYVSANLGRTPLTRIFPSLTDRDGRSLL